MSGFQRFRFSQNNGTPAGVARLLRRLARDRSGVTAIEFGLIAVPFMMFMMGIIGVGLMFFITFSLENAVEQASRLVRTGQAQTSGMTTDQFKQQVCAKLPDFVNCNSDVRVFVDVFTDFSSISTPSCTTTNGSGETVLVGEGAPTAVSGGAGAVVLITACYYWDLGKKLPYLTKDKSGEGWSFIRASTTLRTEPYQ